MAKNNRSKSACTFTQRKRLNNQAVWPVIFGITGPICARALNLKMPAKLGLRGHHDWPVMPTIHPLTSRAHIADGASSMIVSSRPLLAGKACELIFCLLLCEAKSMRRLGAFPVAPSQERARLSFEIFPKAAERTSNSQ